jgi:hypothetical protein
VKVLHVTIVTVAAATAGVEAAGGGAGAVERRGEGSGASLARRAGGGSCQIFQILHPGEPKDQGPRGSTQIA